VWGTQTWIDPVKGVASVLIVQRSNFPNSDASNVRREFQKAASTDSKTKPCGKETIPCVCGRHFSIYPSTFSISPRWLEFLSGFRGPQVGANQGRSEAWRLPDTSTGTPS